MTAIALLFAALGAAVFAVAVACHRRPHLQPVARGLAVIAVTLWSFAYAAVVVALVPVVLHA